MFNEVPVPGKTTYKKGDCTSIAVHTDTEIRGFFADFRWLSNFHLAPVEYEGVRYPSSENAYQAAKVKVEFRDQFITITPSVSKLAWQKYPLFDATPQLWDARKYNVMKEILIDKFTRNAYLCDLLLSTKGKYLEEKNYWGDTYWGVDVKLGGQNNLGKILMEIRDSLIK